MPDGALVYRASVGSEAGKIVRVGVRECPDPAVARLAIESAFADVNGDDAAVRWEARR